MKHSKNIDELLQKHNSQVEKRGKTNEGLEPIYNIDEKDFFSFLSAAKDFEPSYPLIWLSVGNSIYCVLAFHGSGQELQFQVKMQQPENFYSRFIQVINV